MTDNQVGTIIPANVNYAKQKPQALQSFSRRVKSLSNNAQSFGENQYCKITLDTSTPGAQIDPLQSYLKFDLTIINSNPFIDYVSFGSAGVAAVIDEFRIYNQGTPIEEILNYGTVYELFMDLSGHCKKPYRMFRPSHIDQQVDKRFEVNAIKAPMVSQNGDPMYFQATFGNYKNNSSFWGSSTSSTNTIQNKPYLLSTTAAGVSFHTFIFTSGSTGATTNEEIMSTFSASYTNLAPIDEQDPTGGPAGVPAGFPVSTQPFLAIRNGNQIGVLEPDVTLLSSGQIFPARQAPPFDLPALVLGRIPDIANAGLTDMITTTGAFWSVGSGSLSATGVSAANQAADVNPNSTNCIGVVVLGTNGTTLSGNVQTVNAPSVYRDYTDGQYVNVNGIPPAASLFGSTTYFMTAADTDPTNPLNWPFIMPNDFYNDTDLPVQNLQDYFMSLFNVKLLPIGIQGTGRGSANSISSYVPSDYQSSVKSSLNFSNSTVLPTTTTQSTTLTVCLPLISGILGSMASKCFPTMLVAPGSTIIDLKTAPASKVFQVSMDPCRRVLGTVRDYVPFGGSLGGVFGQFTYLNPFGDLSDTDDASLKTPLAFANSLMSNLNYLKPGATASGTNNVQTPVSTPWLSNSYFGVGSGSIYMPATTYANGAISSALHTNELCVTAKPNIGAVFACIGANMLPLQTWLNTTNGSQFSASLDLMFSPYSVAAMEGKWTQYDKVSEKIQTTFMTSIPSNVQDAGTVTWNGVNSGAQQNLTPINPPYTGSLQTVGFGTDTSGSFDTAGAINKRTYTGFTSANGVVDPNTNLGVIASNQPTAAWNQGVLSVYSSSTGQYNTSLIGDGANVQGGGSLPYPIYASNTMGLAAGYTWMPRDSTEVTFDNVPSGTLNVNLMNNTSPTLGYCTGMSVMSPSGRNIVLSAPPLNSAVKTLSNGQIIPINGDSATKIPNLMEVTVCGHPSGVPLPQYMLVTKPWAKKALYATYRVNVGTSNTYNIWGETVGSTDLASETVACFGTYLPHSVAQSMRCFNQYGGNTDYVKYTMSNVEFVSQQIILPDPVTAQILQIAAVGEGISIATTGIRTYQSPVSSSTSQNIIIPAKTASANALYVVFQPQNYSNTTEGQLYNSFSRFCPFSQIYSMDPYPQSSCTQSSSVISQAVYSSGQTALGQNTPFGIVNAKAGSNFQIQLVMGNDYVPQQPITSIPELVTELTKCQHKLFDTSANQDTSFCLVEKSGFATNSSFTKSNVFSYPGSDSSTSGSYYYNAIEPRGFCSAFTFPAWLDDQTYVANPNWNYIGACLWNGSVTGYGGTAGLTGSSPGTKALFGQRGDYVLPMFTPQESTFVIGFDLDTWSGYSDISRSGVYLGNSTITLHLENAVALAYQSSGSKTTGLSGINMYSIVVHDLRLSFQAGGSIQPFY
jgi:hypothetical protein